MNKEEELEKISRSYTDRFLKSSNEYLGCDSHRRKQLIQRNLYDVEKAFKDGWRECEKLMIEKTYNWLKENASDYVVTCYDKGELDDEGLLLDFRNKMLEE